MKDNDILSQAAEIASQTETMVKHAHRMLRNDELNRSQFVEIKQLEVKAQRLYRKLKDESR
jgi:hypothetical protein